MNFDWFICRQPSEDFREQICTELPVNSSGAQSSALPAPLPPRLLGTISGELTK
jgi:hypothetical protein